MKASVVSSRHILHHALDHGSRSILFLLQGPYYSGSRRPLSVILLFFSFLMHAAHLSYSQSKIEGIVTDSRHVPIAYANVLLLQRADSSFVKGAVTDSTGNFSLQDVDQGKFFLTGTMIGYKTNYLPVDVSGANPTVIALRLTEDLEELSEVLIQAQKPLFEQQMDRLVVNVKSSIISSGSTVLEVLSRTPGITVNRQSNTISINGKDGVMVMLNDKMVRLPLDAVVQMLSGMNTDQIEKIEIITSPPARLDSEGNAGLINIVNSKSQEMGTTGAVSGNLGYGYFHKGYVRFGGSLNLTHRTEKFSFFMDYTLIKNNFLGMFNSSQLTHRPNGQYLSEVSSEKRFRDWNQNGRIGIDFILTPKTTLGAQFSAFSNKSDQLAFNTSEITLGGISHTHIDFKDKERNHWRNFAVNLNLTHRFTPDHTLSIDGDYLYFFHKNPHTYHIHSQYLRENMEEEEQLDNRKHTPIHMWVSKIDYKVLPHEKVRVEAGIKGFMSDVENNINAWSSKEESVLLETLNQHVLMKENIGAAYLSMDATFNAMTKMQAGLRYEHTYTFLQNITQEPILEKSYGNIFPSFSISQDFINKNRLQFSYSHRITRPTFSDLAPFFTLLDPFTFISGNMELLPAKSHSLQTNFQFKNNYRINFDFTHVSNFIHWDILVVPDQNIQLIQKNNFDNTKNLSLTISGANNFTSWWEGQSSVQGVYQHVRSISQEVPLTRSNKYLRFNTTQTVKFGNGYSAELSGFYQSRSLAGLLILKPFGSLNVGLHKELKANKGTFRLSGEDLLWTQSTRFLNGNPLLDYKAGLDIKLTTRLVRLTFSRNFGNRHIKSAKRDTGSEEERKRVQ